ncbi:hypothetical protein BGX31_004035 [Mortierella sp. GBA43]|nr:hypothetical protein BGX31_004035 [Mortierella sp. GBA43]
MTSKQQDDNFDLYDDPYVATGGSGGADPYAEDDDDYYGSGQGDRGRSGYDDMSGRDNERSRYQSNRDGADSRNRDRLDEGSSYDQQRGQQLSSGAQDSEGYDPSQPYHQQRDAPYRQQQPQQQQKQQPNQQQPLSNYSRTPQQGSSQYGSEAGSYNQPSRPQQQPTSSQSSTPGGREHGKMFIGGLNWETTDESLKTYFSRFGELTDCMVMKDPITNKSRGFGFLTFVDPKNVDAVLKEDHYLDGKMASIGASIVPFYLTLENGPLKELVVVAEVLQFPAPCQHFLDVIDPKRAIPREEQEKTEKIFVGGIAADVTEEEFANYFSQFGNVIDATLMLDRATGRPRGFGFITFESDRGVEAALSRRDLQLHDKPIEVKRAQPKHRTDGRGASASFGSGGFGAQAAFGGFGGAQGGYGANMAGGRNFGADSMGAMMAGGSFGNNFGNGPGGVTPDQYQALNAYAVAAAARLGASPQAAAAALRYRMAAWAAYGGGGAAGVGAAGGGAAGGGYDAAAMSALYRPPFAYGGAGAGNSGNQGGYGANSGGGYGDQDAGGSQSSQRRYGGQAGSDGGSGAGYNGSGGSSSYGAGGASGGNGASGGGGGGGGGGYESRGGSGGGSSGGGGGSGSGYGAGRGSSGSGGGRQGGSGGGSTGGPVRGSGGSGGSGGGGGGGGSSSGSHGRGGSYHPYQR